MVPLLGRGLPSTTGRNAMQMRGVLAIAPRRLDDPDVTALQGAPPAPAETSSHTLEATAHAGTQPRAAVVIKCGPSQRGPGQDTRAIEEALLEPRAALTDPVIHLDVGAAQAQRRLAAHRDAMGALATMQTAGCERAPVLRVPTGQPLGHQASIGGRLVAWRGVYDPLPVLGTALFEDVPGRRSCCSHYAAALRNVEWWVIALFYHIPPTTSTPSPAFTGADSPTPLTFKLRGLHGNLQMEIPVLCT
jgi:hypothetical protein